MIYLKVAENTKPEQKSLFLKLQLKPPTFFSTSYLTFPISLKLFELINTPNLFI